METPDNSPPQAKPSAPLQKGDGPHPPPRFWKTRRVRVMAVLVVAAVVAGIFIRGRFPWAMASWNYSSAAKHLMQGSLDEALADCDRALEWMPKTPKFYELRADIHLQQGQLQAARRDCDKLLKLNPDYPQGYHQRSRIFLLLAEENEGESRKKFYEKAIGDSETAKHWLGDKDASGPTLLSDIIAVANGFNHLAYTRAVAEKELDQALEDVQRAISMLDRDEKKEDGEDEDGEDEDDEKKDDEDSVRPTDSIYARFLDTRGFVYFRLQQYDMAINDLTEAIQTFSRVKKDALKRIGDQDLDRKNNAEKQMNATLGLMHRHLGRVYEKRGDAKEAKANQDKAEELGYDPKKHGQ